MNSKNTNSPEVMPDKSKVVLLIIDMISDFEFEDAEKLFDSALSAAHRISELKRAAKKAEVPVIYINDNFGKWQEDFRKITEKNLKAEVRGSEIVRLLKPQPDDYYALKPKHSAFYSTPLDLILAQLESEIIILTGISTDICILFTANDAYMRGYKIIIPTDCVAATDAQENETALKYIKRVLKADICSSKEIDFNNLLKS